MKPPPEPAPRASAGSRRRHATWPAAVLAGLLALPGPAHPIGLAQLLRLPLEQLLRLEIAVAPAAKRAPPCRPAATSPRAGGSAA